VLVHRDYKQQEVRIAAILSGDTALLEACAEDVYVGIARQLGFYSDSMDDDKKAAVRALFKTVVLGISYGLGYRSLAVRTGISRYEAREILARLKARFCRYENSAKACLIMRG
jgi:DNA polymerase I-like protein with 3'-5' exonuclease and polymerase domains